MSSLHQNHIPGNEGKSALASLSDGTGLLVSRAGQVILILFILVNLALLITVEEGAQLSNGADAGTWHNPALALLKYGALVELDDPATPMTYRQPLYPLFDAALLWLGGGKSLIPVIVGQVVLLWITGLFSRAMVEIWLPRYGVVALALVVFASWRPGRLLLGAYLFGAASILHLVLQGLGWRSPTELLAMLPYVVTILMLILLSFDPVRTRLNTPLSLGQPYRPGH